MATRKFLLVGGTELINADFIVRITIQENNDDYFIQIEINGMTVPKKSRIFGTHEIALESMMRLAEWLTIDSKQTKAGQKQPVFVWPDKEDL